jgi:hypothetical protein
MEFMDYLRICAFMYLYIEIILQTIHFGGRTCSNQNKSDHNFETSNRKKWNLTNSICWYIFEANDGGIQYDPITNCGMTYLEMRFSIVWT